MTNPTPPTPGGAPACPVRPTRGRPPLLAAWLVVASVVAVAALAIPGGHRAEGQAVVPDQPRPPAVRLHGIALEPLVRSHLRGLIEHGTDRYGDRASRMWMASLDLDTLAYPEQAPKALAGQRVYRDIDAPFGVQALYDLPQWELALRLWDKSGEHELRAAVLGYFEDFLDPDIGRAVGEHGLWAWGEHYYYDAFAGRLRFFTGGRDSDHHDDPDRGYHELRPCTPDWDLLWELDAGKTEALIYGIAGQHVRGGFNSESGEFDRHGDVGDGRVSSYSFIEAGGVIVESLAWLHARLEAEGRPDDRLAPLARRVARFSWDSRDPGTGLMPVQVSTERWDKLNATSETGVWAGALLRASDLLKDPELADWAAAAVGAWLEHAWDPVTERYFGKVRVDSGEPDLSRTTPYQPADHSHPWNAFFPTHDYTLITALTVVELWRRTEDERWREAIGRLSRVIELERPASLVIHGLVAEPDDQRPGAEAHDGIGAYAESYGLAIEFFRRAGEGLGDRTLREAAERTAHEAVTRLYHQSSGLFRGHAGEDRYDAVDGVGILGLALLELDGIRIGRLAVQQQPESLLLPLKPRPGHDHEAMEKAGGRVFSEVRIQAGPGLPTLTHGDRVLRSERGRPAPAIGITGEDAVAGSLDEAIDGDQYIGIEVDIRQGMTVELSHLTWQMQRTAGDQAPTHYALLLVQGDDHLLLACDRIHDRWTESFVSLLGRRPIEREGTIELRFYFHGGAEGNQFARLDNIHLHYAPMPANGRRFNF